jgi:N-acetylneuraminic acid mutarotase/glucose/arabinose dehydrogenase
VYTFERFAFTATPTGGQAPGAFVRTSFPVSFPTSMVWGPDDRLYVSELFGDINAFTLGANNQVLDQDVITTLGTRMTLGIAIDPASTSSNVVLWASHTSPSIDDGEVNSGVISRLSGPGLADRQDVITGLPRAKANHGLNSLHFGPDGRLYIAAGGNTGSGAPNTASTEFGDRPEQPLSAALLVADVNAAGFQGSCATPLHQFGIPATCDVTPWATGLRNMYDFVFHTNGQVYGPDNGLGVIGTYPPSPTPDCTGLADASLHNPGEQPDRLQRLQAGRYYGHPNPYRNECVFFDGSKQGVAPLPNFEPSMFNLGRSKSANGIVEYRGDAFCGSLRGELLVANYSRGDDITRIRLAADGRSVIKAQSLIGGFTDPLPLAESPTGTIFVGEFGDDKVTALAPQPTGCWATKQPLPVQRLDAGGAALDGKVYVVAGKTTTAHQSTVHVYDPASDAWSTVANLPGPAVENPAVVAHQGKLYVFGGGTGAFSGAVTNAAVFDPGTGQWTTLAPMPVARGGPGAAAIGDSIYVVGGLEGTGASLSSMSVYDITTGTWSAGAAMANRRDNPGVAALGGKLYAFGGRTRNADGTTVDGTLDTVEMFDPSTGTWSARASMPTGRRTPVVATLDGRALVIGGEAATDGSPFSANEEYDPVTNSWRTLTPMLTARHGAAGGAVDGVVYVISGGPQGGTTTSNVNEAFTLTTG